MFTIFHIVAFDDSRSNGPSVSVVELSNAMNRLPMVCSSYYRPGDDLPIDSVNLVVFHGVWQPRFWVLARRLHRHKVPYAIAPRSNLVKASLAKSTVKKVIGLLAGAHGYIKRSAGLHFLSREEASRSYRFNKNYIIAGNGVYMPTDNQLKRQLKDVKFPLPPRYILFLGRLDMHHKGLDILLKAVAKCKNHLKVERVKIVVAGDPVGNSVTKLKGIIHDYQLKNIVVLVPRRIKGLEKTYILRKASAFIHTSRYEGEPQAVMEAIAYNLPVLVTKGANLDSFVESNGLGIVAETNIDSVAAALATMTDLMSRGQETLDRRKTHLEYRNWDLIAKKTVEGYRRFL